MSEIFMLNQFRNSVERICYKYSINYKLLSKDWIIMLEKNGKIRFISGCKFPLNNHALGEILDDKYALYDVFRVNNIPVVEHNILYSTCNKNQYALDSNNYDLVKDFFNKNHNIVLKPNKGTCGTDVYNIKKIGDIDDALDNLFKKYTSISYCPFYKIKNEYRVVVLNNNIELIYRKVKPIVIGDGKNTIRELLINFNYDYFVDKLEDNSFDRVLKKEEVYEYCWKFNLSNGAIAKFDVNNNVKENLVKIVTKILNKFEMNFVSIDIIETEKNFLVLEVNSGVMFERLFNMVEDKKILDNIYEKAILLMFKE